MISLKRFILRWRMKLALRAGRGISLNAATRLWRLSDTIYIGPVGPGARVLPECEAFRALADDRAVTNDQISSLLQSPSPSVAGYGLEILIRRQADNLENAIAELAHRQEEVTMGLTSFVCYSPLGEYAANRLNAEQGVGGQPATAGESK